MLKTIKRIQLTIAIVLAGVTTSVAQTVTVPANCTVVSTNTTLGGVLGAGGKVTSGGVVTMPDPSGGGVFSLTGPTGVTLGPIISWNLSGDLSSATTTPNYDSPVQPANGTSATIISYNKFLRSSEGLTPSVATWARSKGRVSVSYTTNLTSCPNVFISGSVSFEIFKTFTNTPITNVPKIVGPDCIEGGKQCTFSVDQVASDNANDAIGFDMYYWKGIPTLVLGTSPYFSADYSSVTFTPATSTGFTLKCCIGRANPWDGSFLPIILPVQAVTGTTCVSKTVGVAPSQPTFAINPNGICVPTGTATSFTINYLSANTCTWTMANTGWTIGAQTASSVTINTNGFNNPGVLTLTVSNGTCTPLTFQYQINRALTAPVTIAPVVAGNNCLLAGSTNNMFSISTSAATNLTTWSVAPAGTGVTLVAGTPNSTVAVNVASTATVGLYTLTAKSASCTGGITYQFRVKPKVPTISGAACVIKSALTAQTYTCLASTGATYTWAFPAGWNASSFTTTTNSITVTPSSATAVLNGTATVTANGVVGCNSSATFAINYASAAPTGVVAGCFSVGLAGGASVAFTNPLPGTYTATMISTVAGSTNVITSPVTLSGSTLSFATSALSVGTYNLAITHNSGCGVAATSTTLVTVAGNGTTLSPNLGVTQDNYFAIVPSSMLNPQYEWTTCTSAGVCTTVGGNSALLSLGGATAPPAGNKVCVTVYPLGSTCKTRLCTSQGTHSRMANTVIKGEAIDGVSIYPNPNSGNFNIKIADFKQEATASLYDFNGKKIKDFTLTKGENKIENDGLAIGTYIVVVSVDEKTDVKQIIIK
jgi:hypothetical protein